MNIGSALERIDKMLSRIDTVDEVIEWAVAENQRMILNLKRDDFLLGRNEDGEPLTPGYTEDPYFKTQEDALAYKAYKKSLELFHNERVTYPLNYQNKDDNTPNLIITGKFQDLMYITVSSDSFEIGSAFDETKDIERKYKNKIWGLSPLAKEYFWDHVLYEKIVKHLYGWL